MKTDTENGLTSRRKFLTGVGAALISGVAGCIDNTTEPTQSTENETGYSNESSLNGTKEENQDQQQQEEEKESDEGLNIDTTWEDIKKAELENFHNTTGVTRALEVVNESHIQNADLTDYDQFQNALLKSVNEIVEDFGRGRSQDSSTAIMRASSAVNIISRKELKNNEEYQREGLEFTMMPMGSDAHGYAQVASTIHPLTTVDSNEPIVGPASEAPLDERNTRDPISRFYNKDFDDVDELERPVYIGFPTRIYTMDANNERSIAIENDVVDEYYDKAITNKDGSLFLGAVRDAVAATKFLIDENYMDEYEALSLASGPEDLPSRSDHGSFGEYAGDIMENHIVGYDTSEDVIKNNRGMD